MMDVVAAELIAAGYLLSNEFVLAALDCVAWMGEDVDA